MEVMEISSILFVLGFSLFILYICKDRNAWDVAFFNTTLATVSLFFIGLLARDKDVWLAIVGVLGVVATAEKIVSFIFKAKS